MNEFTFHYGRGPQTFSLDESKIIKEIRMPETPVMEDVPKGVLEAIYNIIGMEPIDKIIKSSYYKCFLKSDKCSISI